MCAGIFVHPSIAFIGLYGVRPELHSRGIGISMWTRMMEHIETTSSNAGLYAVTEHLAMYRDRAGFRSPDDRLLFIYESNGIEQQPLNTGLLVDQIRGIGVVAITEQLYDHIIRFDTKVHGYSRAKLLLNVFKGITILLINNSNNIEIRISICQLVKAKKRINYCLIIMLNYSYRTGIRCIGSIGRRRGGRQC